jgi:peptidoglycan/LPS O-acetylase OafA/YrhL
MDLIYVKPYARISPYIVGILLGYAFYKGAHLPFGRFGNRLAYLTVWVASGLILVPTLYGLYFIWHGHETTKVENILYITFSRFSWGVGLALIVFACHNGYGGYINTFLSLKIWTPLARMTYNAYLVHLIIIRVFYGQIQSAIHLTDFTMAVYTVAIVVLAYAVAAVVCVCVEFPLGTLELLVFEMAGLGGRGVTQRQGSGALTEVKKK